MSFGLIVLVFSTIFIAVGVYLWQRGSYLLAKGKIADAVVFSNHAEVNSEYGTVYYPVVRFLTFKQEWITQQLKIGYSPAKPVGSKLQVIYDPNDPTTVEINSSLLLVFIPRLFVAIGIAGFIGSAWIYVSV